MEVYRIRLQVIAAADDDGSNKANLTATAFAAYVPIINKIFVPAKVEFTFDPDSDYMLVHSTLVNREFTPLEMPNVGPDKWDHEPAVDSETHTQARNNLAKQFADKLVIMYRNRKTLEEGEDGNWAIVNRGGGASSSNAYFVNMSTISNGVDLGHEVGHFLQLPHTFVSDAKTVEQAAAKIKAYVEAGNRKQSGLSALDGDRKVVLDTPADARGEIFVSEGLEKCGDVGSINIPVKFADGTVNYSLTPDRNLVMSYFKGCSALGEKTISPQQARRVRDGLEMRNRHKLIDAKPAFDLKLKQRGSASGGKISDVEVAMVRAGRVATAVRNSEGNLKVIVWDIDKNGQIERKGDAEAGAVSKVSICGLGQQIVATTVITSGKMKIILWQVKENGQVERMGDVIEEGEVTDIASCISRYGLGSNFMATAARMADGKLRVSAFETLVNGEIFHRSTAMAGEVNNDVPGLPKPKLTIAEVGAESLVTHVRLNTGELRSILWQLNDDEKLVRLGDTTLSNVKVGSVSACQLSRESQVVAIQDQNQNLQLVGYGFPDDAKYISQKSTATAGGVSLVDTCRVGTEMVVTAVKTSNNFLKVILWQVTNSVSHIIRLTDDLTDIQPTQISLCYSDRSQVVAVVRNSSGNIQLVSWNVEGPLRFIGNLNGKVDAFQTIVKNAPDSRDLAPKFLSGRGGECQVTDLRHEA